MKQITSADNPQYKQLKKLASNARERRKCGQTLLDGVHLLQALADAGGTTELLIVRQGSGADAEIQRCLEWFPTAPVIELVAVLFDAISPVETPVGILALYTIPQPEESMPECAVLLENIQDPGNIGAILRTAAAAGANAVYLSKGCAEAWSPKVLRAAMGAHFVLAIYEQQDLAQLSADLPTVIATRLDAEQSLYDLDLHGQVAFLFGNEGAGLSDELAVCATHHVTIPMPGKVESLNVAAAAAVCLFERVRQISRSSGPALG
ncbi:MAG: RNA methyltransferase [Pseudomonadota bacterium]|nr:RNA methyltransferase [Pseudomonadota bacterium]